MDNSVVTWSPKPALLAVAGFLTLSSAAGSVIAGLDGDRGGLVFFAVGAAFFGAATAYGLIVRPRLAANRSGLTVRTASGRHRLDWPLTRIKLVHTRRFGRDSVTIEVESGELFVVLGWLDLGADPRDVIDVLAAMRP